MLDLDDPLWRKLDDASYREFDIPKLLSLLAETWDGDQANSLFWDCLLHQETCYGATYAAIPHLLTIAEPGVNRHQRLEIAIFLGTIARCAFRGQYQICKGEQGPLEGLPETLDEWNGRRDRYRDRIVTLEDPNHPSSRFEQTVVLPYYKNSLKIDPLTEDDLQKIRLIRRDFFEALPNIRALCERAFLENIGEGELGLYLLAGIAATVGLYDLANTLAHGVEGTFKCSSCDWTYEYHLFKDRIAIYAEEEINRYCKAHLDDYEDGAPLRADGFMLPIAVDERIADRRVAALLELASRATVPIPMLLLRNFLGRFDCRKCGAERPVVVV